MDANRARRALVPIVALSLLAGCSSASSSESGPPASEVTEVRSATVAAPPEHVWVGAWGRVRVYLLEPAGGPPGASRVDVIVDNRAGRREVQPVELLLTGSDHRAFAPVCVVDDPSVCAELSTVPPGQVGLRQFDGAASADGVTEIRLHLVDTTAADRLGSWLSLRSLHADAVDVPRPGG